MHGKQTPKLFAIGASKPSQAAANTIAYERIQGVFEGGMSRDRFVLTGMRSPKG